MRTRTILAGLLLPAALAGAAEPVKVAAVSTATAPGKPAPAAGKPSAPAAKDEMKPDMMMSGDAMMSGGMMASANAPVSPEHAAFFKDKVEPILAANCYKCHSVEKGKSKGGLTVDTREGILKGGENGAFVKPGNPADSLLITAINYQDPDMKMPPKDMGGKMSQKEIDVLTAWVKMGAPDPRKSDAKAIASKLSGLTDKARAHWAYQPLEKPPVPAPKDARTRSWCSTPIDAFIAAKLDEKHLTPGKGLMDTDVSSFEQSQNKAALIRRAYFDLIGLPPSPDDIDAFFKDTSPQAFAKVVEKLLASPAYGERWGRFWLDTARYSDTVGGDRNQNSKEDYRYPYAWTYRDWVIKAFNNDMPYDQFVMNQLAADKMPNNDRKNLAALGFITVGERFGNGNDTINDRIDVVSKGFLGLTVACARCHDHMFDPIPTKDYYALHGVFSSIYEPDDQPLLNQPDPKLLKEFEAKIAKYEADDRNTYFNVLEEGAAEFRGKARQYLQAAFLGQQKNNEKALQEREKLIQDYKLDEQLVNYVRGRIGGDERVWGPYRIFREMADGDYDFLGPKKCAEIAKEAGKRYNKRVAERFATFRPAKIEDVVELYMQVFESSSQGADEAMKAARNAEAGKPLAVDRDTIDLAGGVFRVYPAYELDTERLRDAIQGWPLRMRNKGRYNFAAINELKMTDDGSPAKAMIVADRKDPRNSPVFIRGQQGTPGDMVPRGFLEVLSPNHKRLTFTKGSGRLELAQAIASKETPLTARVIVNRVWMHHFGEGFVRTPDDLGTQSEAPSHPELIEYLSHWFVNEGKWSLKNLHRFIMNSKVYQISSQTVKAYEDIDPDNRYLWRANIRRLDFEAMRDSLLAMSGKLDTEPYGQPVNLTDEPYSHRRTVYGYIDRGNLPDLMSHFDFSDPHMPNSKRTSTIVPQQALFLMNSPFTVDVARSIVARPEVQNAPDNVRRVYNIYKIVFSRLPKPTETQMAFEFMRKEKDAEPQYAAEMAQLTERAKKKVEDRKKRNEQRGMNDGLRAIQNQGDWVERKPLDFWETYVHALLLSNEASYVN